MKPFNKALLLAVLAIAIPLSSLANKTVEVDHLFYTLQDNGTAFVSGYNESANLNDLTIPETITYNGHPYNITVIWKEAFYKCSSLRSVDIPNTVISIGDWAFGGCDNLLSITIPNSLKNIESFAFSEPYYGGRRVFISSLESWCKIDFAVGSNPLCRGNLYLNNELVEDLIIPESIEEIKDYAFAYCKSLRSVSIPNSVKRIGESSFEGCFYLTNISLPISVNSIGSHAFYNCQKITSIDIPMSVHTINEYAFFQCRELKSIKIPNSLTEIEESVFKGCTNLTSIHIPNSVTSIGNGSFAECTSLTSIDIPNSVTSIGNGSFSGCSSLTSIDIPDSVGYISDQAFYRCNGLTSIEIPNFVRAIGDKAFYECTGLTSLTIPNTVTSIGAHAFAKCTGLKECIIEDQIDVEKDCFTNRTAFYESPIEALYLGRNLRLYSFQEVEFNGIMFNDLKSISISHSVSYIDRALFSGCKTIGSITIPNSVTEIYTGVNGKSAFNGCSGLKEFVFEDGDQPLDFTYDTWSGSGKVEPIFNNCPIETLHLGRGINRKNLLAGMQSIKKITIGNFVKSIDASTFEDCTGLQSIDISNSVTEIGDRAFAGCTLLTSIAIPNSVTIIGPETFEGTKNLDEVFILSLESWCNIHFSDKYSNPITNKLYLNGEIVENLVIPETIHEIKDYTFNNCKSIKTISLPNTVASIGKKAFAGCSNLTSIDFPQSVTRIGSQAFSGCVGLTSITIPNSVLSIGSLAFLGCELKDFIVEDGDKILDGYFDLPYSVTTLYLGRNLSQNVHIRSSMNNLTLGKNITDIGEKAFQECNQLQNITVLATNPPLLFDTSFGQKAYDNGIVRVPDNSVEKFKNADGWKNFRDITGINEIRPTGIELEFDNIVIAAGDSMLLKAKIVPENATNQTILWSSSEPEYLSIDSNGLMTALRQREYIKITATTSNGFSAYRYVTVTPPPVKYISLSPENWSGKVGEYLRIDAEVFPEDAEVKEIEWSSSDESIVTINMLGIGVARGVGEADIIATSVSNNDVKTKCHITVIPTKIESIKLNTGWCYPGDIFQIKTWIYPETATYKTLSWSISDETIASVDSDGWVTAHVPGETILTVKALDGSEVEATTDIIVYQIFVESISLTPDTWNGVEGESFKIEADVMPENAYNKTLLWSSSDEDVATVDQEGYVSVLKEGNCIITATSTDGLERSAECIITSIAGIDSILSENDTLDIYNVNGILIRKDCNVEFLKNLAPDVYVIKQGYKTRKLIIR